MKLIWGMGAIPTLAILVLLLAYGLRVFKLGEQSLWADEGYGLYLAQLPLSELAGNLLVDLNHVPLYFLTLHFWIRLAGESELAVRALSLAGGVLVVALSYRLGRDLFGRAVGVVAALVSAITPFQVYYSQEARMHIWTTAICLFAALLLVRAVTGPTRRGLWVGYAIVGAAALYTFYYSGFVLAGFALAGLIALVTQKARRRDLAAFFGAHLGIAVAFLPWIGLAAVRLLEQAEHKKKDFVVYSWFDFLHLNWKTYLAGVTAEPDHLPWPTWPVLFAFVLGLFALRRSRRPELLPLYLGVPLLGVFLINVRFPHFLPRYLLLVTPAFYLLLAAGLVEPFRAGGRRAVVLGAGVLASLAVLVATTGQSLANNYFDPRYGRDDYRGVAQRINREFQPDDVIILNAPWQIYNFPYYYQGPLTLTGLPYEDPLDPAITEPKLREITGRHAGVWLVLYGNASMDPTGYVERWLDEHAYKVDDWWHGTIRLARYINPVVSAASQPGSRFAFAGGVGLAAIEMPVPAVAGERLPVRLLWRADRQPEDGYQSSVRLVDTAGRVWSQSDGPPLGGAVPTDEWRPGQTYRDPRVLDLPVGLAPGQYDLRLFVYTDDGVVEPRAGHLVGQVPVAADPRRDRPDPPVARKASGSLGSAYRVIGADVDPRPVQPGMAVDARVYLRGPIGGSDRLRLLLNHQGREIVSVAFPAMALASGELRLVPLSFRVPIDAADGTAEIRVTSVGNSVSLGSLDIRGRQRNTLVPADLRRVDQPAGGGVVLAGLASAAERGNLVLRLAWRAGEDVDRDQSLTAFIHVVASDGRIAAQSDAPPGGIDAPSTSWITGEVILDERRLSVGALPAGEYLLFAGLYQSNSGRRVGPGDGRLALGMITIP